MGMVFANGQRCVPNALQGVLCAGADLTLGLGNSWYFHGLATPSSPVIRRTSDARGVGCAEK